MPKFLFYSCLCCTHSCLYTCTVHTDCDCTVVFPLWPIGASHQSRGHHTHTHTIHTHRFKCWAQVPRLKIRWRGPSRQARGIPSLLQAPLCLCMAPKPDVCRMKIVLITNRITNYSAIVESFLHTLNKSFVPPILSYERSFTWNLKVTISILLLTLLTHVNIVNNS